MSGQAQLPFDITERRHRGNAESRQANGRLDEYKAVARERIRVFVAACVETGATLSEIAEILQHPVHRRAYHPNEISGRVTELRIEEKIFKSGRRRRGGMVYVARPQWVNGSAT